MWRTVQYKVVLLIEILHDVQTFCGLFLCPKDPFQGQQPRSYGLLQSNMAAFARVAAMVNCERPWEQGCKDRCWW